MRCFSIGSRAVGIFVLSRVTNGNITQLLLNNNISFKCTECESLRWPETRRSRRQDAPTAQPSDDTSSETKQRSAPLGTAGSLFGSVSHGFAWSSRRALGAAPGYHAAGAAVVTLWHHTLYLLCSSRHTPPPLGYDRRIHVFILVVSAPIRRTSHPSGSRPRDVPLCRQTSAPGIFDAPENPRFPAMSNRVQRTDRMAPSRVQL